MNSNADAIREKLRQRDQQTLARAFHRSGERIAEKIRKLALLPPRMGKLAEHEDPVYRLFLDEAPKTRLGHLVGLVHASPDEVGFSTLMAKPKHRARQLEGLLEEALDAYGPKYNVVGIVFEMHDSLYVYTPFIPDGEEFSSVVLRQGDFSRRIYPLEQFLYATAIAEQPEQ